MIVKCEIGGQHYRCDRCPTMLNRDSRGAPVELDDNGAAIGDVGLLLMSGAGQLLLCRKCYALLWDVIVPRFVEKLSLDGVEDD